MEQPQQLSPTTPSRTHEWYEARWGDGREHPSDLATAGGPQLVERTFLFVDLCSFTNFCDVSSPASAIAELNRFRGVVRDVAVRRGVRVAKWLGDGAMLVALDAGAGSACAVEIVGRAGTRGGLAARAGASSGAALLFDGDDHIGRPVNLASRLCDLAGPNEVYVTADVAAQHPSWVLVNQIGDLDVRGIGAVEGVHSLGADTTVSFSDLDNHLHSISDTS